MKKQVKAHEKEEESLHQQNALLKEQAKLHERENERLLQQNVEGVHVKKEEEMIKQEEE